jgi:hypothetical protein
VGVGVGCIVVGTGVGEVVGDGVFVGPGVGCAVTQFDVVKSHGPLPPTQIESQSNMFVGSTIATREHVTSSEESVHKYDGAAPVKRLP